MSYFPQKRTTQNNPQKPFVFRIKKYICGIRSKTKCTKYNKIQVKNPFFLKKVTLYKNAKKFFSAKIQDTEQIERYQKKLIVMIICQNPNLITSQPIITKVQFYTATKVWVLHENECRAPPPTHTNLMLAISQLLLSEFRLQFKGRFL